MIKTLDDPMVATWEGVQLQTDIDKRFKEVHKRFDQVEKRLGMIENKLMARHDRKIELKRDRLLKIETKLAQMK